jgi:hypothetical protein
MKPHPSRSATLEKTMKRLLSTLLVGPVLLCLAVVTSAQDKMPETPYYPLQVGTTWHYKVNGSPFRWRVSKHEKVGDVLCARVEMTVGDRVVGWQHLAITADGVYRHDLAYRPPTTPDQKGGETVTETPKPPVLLLRLPPKAGETFKVDSKAEGKPFRGAFKMGEAEVKVPAGSYKVVTVTSQDLEANGLKPVITSYYASGVGLVKQVIEEGGVKVETELEKFEPAK